MTGLSRSLMVAAVLAVLAGCSPARMGNEAPGGQDLNLAQDGADNDLHPLPGTPGLSAGARIAPDSTAEQPLPRQAATAGIDFAANRFIVFFVDAPAAHSFARYLDGDPALSGSDRINADENAPLVQHSFLRKVSHNLAGAYGLREYRRVFYKSVNFAVYELPQVSEVAELDAMMLRVLHDNPGLVREVCYDFFLRVDGQPLTPEADPGAAVRAAQRRFAVEGPALAGARSCAAQRSASTPPAYNNPDPYCLNQAGFDTNQGDGESDSGTWPLWRIGASLDQAWSYTTGSSDTVICVLDTGVRFTHEDIADNCVNPLTDPPYNAPGILTDVVNKDNDPNDGHGHGSFCAGEIAARGNNGKGLAGVCWTCTLLPIKVVADSGVGSDSKFAEGMLLADYLGADIISMSFGGYFSVRATQLSVRQCSADGMLLVAGAGNSNTSAPFYPAYYPECLAVGATTLVNAANDEDFSVVGTELPLATRFDARTDFSQYGPWVDIASPGHHCISISNLGDSLYGSNWSGTSMATPYVSGCAGLLWSALSNPGNTKVRGLLLSGATQMDHLNNAANPGGFLDNSGSGTVRFVNVYQSLLLNDAGSGTATTLNWDNPPDGATVSGIQELRVAASGGSGNIRKVEFETFARLIGTQTSPSGGFYRQPWDSAFEFNRPLEIRARAYDDKGNITVSTITVMPSNPRKVPGWSENFNSLASDEIPSGWFELEGNQGTLNTSWGADAAQFVSGPMSMHSSGAAGSFAVNSNDYLYAPLIDLQGYARATLSFQRRYQTPANEAIYLLVSTDDKTYFDRVFANTTMQGWSNFSYDLSEFGGREIRVLWALANYGNNTAPGMWIDDVVLSATAGTAPTISIDAPANGASVSGLVPVIVTVSDDTKWIDLFAEPPDIASLRFTPIPDNDPLNPTKSYQINWDSRHVYNGAAQLTLSAWDDEDNDNLSDDFVASAAVSVSVTNPARNPVWYEGFENINTLGGLNGNSFDGDWFIWQGGANKFRITMDAGQFRSGAKGCKFGPVGGGNYGPGEQCQLFSPTHDCSSALRPYLRFWQQLDVEAAGGDYGKLLLLKYDGTEDVRIPLAEYRQDTLPAGAWQEVDISLSRWKSSGLRFNLLFVSDADSGAGNVGTGWFIDDFEVLDADPHINSLSSTRGPKGSTLVINGARFGNQQGSSSVSFAKQGGGRTIALISSWSNTQIQAIVPDDARTGDVIVTLLGFDSNGSNFKVLLAAPELSGIGQL